MLTEQEYVRMAYLMGLVRTGQANASEKRELAKLQEKASK